MANYYFMYSCHKERFAEYLNQKHFVDKPLTFREVKNGYILPHRVHNDKNAGGRCDTRRGLSGRDRPSHKTGRRL